MTAKDAVPPELKHRGELSVTYPAPGLIAGSDDVAELIRDLYQRIENDELLRDVFPHFRPEDAVPFFVQWFGGSKTYSDDLDAGLLRQHQHRYISPKSAAAWLRCMRDAVTARGWDAKAIMKPLEKIANMMIHSPEVETDRICKSCDGHQDETQRQFDGLLGIAAKGQTEIIRDALQNDPSIACRRGIENRTLAWAATYGNRPKVLELVLTAGGDCNSPGCDPLEATMACDIIQLGTGVAVTPLAIAKKWHPKLVPLLIEHGAVDDIFTAVWLGDLVAVRDELDRHPEFVNAIDPVDDFQEATPLCHAVVGGNIEVVKLLLERGAEVGRHSGKLLTPAVVMNRADLVKLLIEHGADVRRVNSLGRLDDAERPVADLLIAHGKKVPDWMLPKACRPDVATNEIHRVNVLLDYGANLNDCGRYGLTALHYAVRGGKLPLIELLLKRGADPNVTGIDGVTPLLHLSKTRSKANPIPVMDLLVSNGADINACDETQNTLLMFFARQGNDDAVKWLLNHGANRNLRNKRGNTAIQTGRAHPRVVQLLMN